MVMMMMLTPQLAFLLRDPASCQLVPSTAPPPCQGYLARSLNDLPPRAGLKAGAHLLFTFAVSGKMKAFLGDTKSLVVHQEQYC